MKKHDGQPVWSGESEGETIWLVVWTCLHLEIFIFNFFLSMKLDKKYIYKYDSGYGLKCFWPINILK